jgi:hypothetical protein
MEELLLLRDALVRGDLAEAFLLLEEMEDMSRDGIRGNIYSYAVVLLLHLIKQAAEKRSTRSWEASIRNSVRGIYRKNKRRKAGGFYFPQEEVLEILEEAFPEAVDNAALEAFGGHYEADELAAMVDRTAILQQALAMINSQAQMEA